LPFYVTKQGDRGVAGTGHRPTPGKVFHWMSATDPDLRNCGANHALLDLVVCEAKDFLAPGIVRAPSLGSRAPKQ